MPAEAAPNAEAMPAEAFDPLASLYECDLEALGEAIAGAALREQETEEKREAERAAFEAAEQAEAEKAAAAPLPFADALLREQRGLTPDEKAFMYGEVKTKRARHNLTFGDEAQEPAYEEKKGRIVAFADVPLLAGVRGQLGDVFGPKAARLRAEGNYYFDNKTCGIGPHGDTERCIVIAGRLGDPMPLVFQWFLNGVPIGPPMYFTLCHGLLYAMSEKAVGTDWHCSTFPTLRHAAGAPKYLVMKK